MTKTITILVLAVMLGVAATLPAMAEFWQAGQDFDPSGMPEPWGYMYKEGGAWSDDATLNPLEPGSDGTWTAPENSQCRIYMRYNLMSLGDYKGASETDGKQAILTFRAPRTGSYTFSFKVQIQSGNPDASSVAWIRKQGSAEPLWSVTLLDNSTGEHPWAPTYNSVDVDLDKGDVVLFGEDIISGNGPEHGCVSIWELMVSETTRVNLAASADAVVSASTYVNAAKKYTKALDGDLTTYWDSNYEDWRANDYPHGWLRVDWPTPRTFNKVDVYIWWSYNYQPHEMVIDVFDKTTGVWTEIARYMNTDVSWHYVTLLPDPVTADAIRYRVEYKHYPAYQVHTQASLHEFGVSYESDTSKWATVSGTVTSNAGRPVKGAFTFFDIGHTHYHNLPTAEDGSYSVTVDTEVAPETTGGNQIATYAIGHSCVTGGDPDGVVRTPTTPIPGIVQTTDVVLPAPEEAFTTLGPVETRTNRWLEQTGNYPTWATVAPYSARYRTEQATIDGVDCLYLANGGAMFRVPPAFAIGYFDKMYVTVEYFDDASTTQPIYLQSSPNPVTFNRGTALLAGSASKIWRENSNTWRSQTLVFDNGLLWDMWYESSLPDIKAGMFMVEAPGGAYISRVAMTCEAGAWNNPDPSVTFGTMGSPGQHFSLRNDDKGLHPRLGIKFPHGSNDHGTIIEDVEGTGIPGYETTGANRNSIWLDIDNNYLYAQSVPTLYVTVKYFDKGTDDFLIQMVNPANYTQTISKSVRKTGTNTWKTATLTFENVAANDAWDRALASYGTGEMMLYDCKDGDDIFASITVSTSPSVSYDVVDTIAAAKAKGSDAKVEFTMGKTVTANFGTFFYVEEEDRTNGIRVNGTTTAAVGQRVTVKGTLSVDENGETVINADSVGLPVPGVALSPLGMANGKLNGSGLSAVGLLVNMSLVTSGSGTGEFEITDGSGAAIKVSASGYSAPDEGTFVTVQGVCGLAGSGVPVIRVVDATTDIQ